MSAWKQHFSQFKDSPKPLSQVLLSGLLPIAEYMKWASEHYKIPFLSDDFFAQTKNYKLLLENQNPEWNEFFFPILEWQGMLYIGALEPHSVSVSKKVCLVLCSPQQLSQLWAKMEKPKPAEPVPLAVPIGEPVTVITEIPAPSAGKATASAKPQPTVPASPMVPPAAHPVAAAPVKPATAAQPVPQRPPVSTPAPTQAPVSSDPLAGILGSKFRLEETKSEVAVKLEDTKSSAGAPLFQDISIKRDPAPEADPVIIPAPAAPLAAKPAASGAQKIAAPTAPPLSLNFDKPTAVQPQAHAHQEPMVVPTSHLKSQGVNVNPNFKETNFNIPEITNVVRARPAAASDSTFTTTKTIMPFPDRTTQFTFIRTVYSEQIIIEAKGKINENVDPQDALISAFRILKDYYKKLMWVVRDQKGQAFPIACNAAWDFSEEAWNLPMDFKTPNPFRIAKATQKPFHGPITKNRASDQFFSQWGDGTYPNVLSIVPVKLHGKVFGYFVGCEKGPHFQQQQSIELMESVCKELIQAFIRIHNELAKSA